MASCLPLDGHCNPVEKKGDTVASADKCKLETENYLEQRQIWPKDGQHILAHYDDETVIVYQAFKPSIAEYAVKNQRFGGPDFSFTRMSWIKTNFLWMMYRCGWASKHNQERVLAVRIKKSGFEEILSKAFTPKEQQAQRLRTDEIEVRLQWDPDHTPKYDKCQRRAIQLGLKNEILEKYSNSHIVEIIDMTEFVIRQKEILDSKGEQYLEIPKERIYLVENSKTAKQIGVSEVGVDHA